MAVTEALREAVTDDGRPSAFVGATFGRIGLVGMTLLPDARLDFRGAMVKSDIDLRDATLDGALRLDRVPVGGAVCMQRFDAAGVVSCCHLQVGDRWVLCEVELSECFDMISFGAGSVVVTGARFKGGATFRKGAADDNVSPMKSRFGGSAWLSHIRLGGRLDLGNAAFDHRLSLVHCRIHAGVMVTSVTVEGGLSLKHVVVDGELNATRLTVDGGTDATTVAFGGRVDCAGPIACDDPVDFTHSVFDGLAYFDNATVEGRALRFQNARFGSGPASFVRTTADGEFDLSNAVCLIDSPARLAETTVDGSVICDHACFDDELLCSGVRVGCDIDFSDCTAGMLTFGVEIEGQLDFAYTHVTDAVAFGDTVVHGLAQFTSARFDAGPSLTEAALDDTVATYDISVELVDGS